MPTSIYTYSRLISLEPLHSNIVLRGAREHNLKNIDIDIPRDKLVVITGLSGSGKSSLAFDTIYAEGQRRFFESLSAYARQFMGMLERPDIDFIDGLSPVISIDQKTVHNNPRSTVGTVTEIYDFLRLLYARVAIPYSWKTGNSMQKRTREQVLQAIMNLPEGSRAHCMAPLIRGRKGHYRELFVQMMRQGYIRAKVDGQFVEMEEGMKLDRYKTHDIDVVVDRFIINANSAERIQKSVDLALDIGEGSVVISIEKEKGNYEDYLYSQKLYDPESGLAYEDPAPNLFSFNSPYGNCRSCNGLGYTYGVSTDLVIPNRSLSINEGAIRWLGKPRDIFAFKQVEAVLQAYGYDFDTPVKAISEEALDALMDGGGDQKFKIRYDLTGSNVTYEQGFEGIKKLITEAYEETKSKKVREKAKAYMSRVQCPSCGGGRLNKEALSYRLGAYSIADLVKMDIRQLRQALQKVELDERQRTIGATIFKEVIDRLDFLLNVGLDYLSLDREAASLSGGEAQRIRLATQIGTQLVGVLYILDEPSIGLHQRDNIKLIRSLETLRDLGNSVLVVEHDRETMEHADWVIDMGPGAGNYGGHIVTQGKPSELDKDSVTAQYLRDEISIPIRSERRNGSGKYIELMNARGHNLQNVDLKLPLGTFIAVTGVSGSGKSSLINQTLVPILTSSLYRAKQAALPYDDIEGMDHIDKIISIDQSPIGRTPRSNPATYTKVFDHIRALYAEMPEAKIRGYERGRFSFNVKGGRCEHCQGDGVRKIEMNFLPDVYVPCEVCRGKRYNRETLEIYYRGKTISEVLDMPITEAYELFEAQPAIHRILGTLCDVGLGYLTLGQSSTTLSGGEAQRVKLARELAKVGTGDTLYIMDEPTTGLHFQDVKMLVDMVQKLVDKGNTVLIIEHNLDLIKAADYVIDLGPEGGRGGGQIIAQGSPEEVAEIQYSYTGKYLKQELSRLPIT